MDSPSKSFKSFSSKFALKSSVSDEQNIQLITIKALFPDYGEKKNSKLFSII